MLCTIISPHATEFTVVFLLFTADVGETGGCERDPPLPSNTSQECQRLEPSQSPPTLTPRSVDGNAKNLNLPRWRSHTREIFNTFTSRLHHFRHDGEANVKLALGSKAKRIGANTHSVYEQILGLQVSMKNVSTVTERKAFQQLVHEWLRQKRLRLGKMPLKISGC